MSNHVYWIVVPERPDAMARTFRVAHSNYSRWLNIRLRRGGHVWQNRFFSCPLDPAHAAYAMRYGEFNPVRAEMVESVLDYPWSSARAHAGLEAAPDWLGANDWAARYPTDKWQQVLGLGFRLSGELDRLREATRTGRPFGAPDFVAELETKLNRVLLPQKRGPKPKQVLLHGSAAAQPILGEIVNLVRACRNERFFAPKSTVCGSTMVALPQHVDTKCFIPTGSCSVPETLSSLGLRHQSASWSSEQDSRERRCASLRRRVEYIRGEERARRSADYVQTN